MEDRDCENFHCANTRKLGKRIGFNKCSLSAITSLKMLFILKIKNPKNNRKVTFQNEKKMLQINNGIVIYLTKDIFFYLKKSGFSM